MSGELLLRCRGIVKNFGPTRALKGVDLEVRRGDIIGLIGENGSGKSTLTSIIAGAQRPDEGTMEMKGQSYSPHTMLDGQRIGIGMIVQEMGTLANVPVYTNVFVGNIDKFKKHGFVDKKRMGAEAARILNEIGAGDIPASGYTAALNFEDKKIVEIARAMYNEPEILIIDESTTALAQKGRKIIYDLIRRMEKENKAVIFISHDLDELMEICNTLTVLRDGEKVAVLTREEMNIPVIRKLMVGRELTDNYYRTDYDGSFSEEVVLKGEQMTSPDGLIMNQSLELHKGEILGIGGLADSGMHELGRMLSGDAPTITGKVLHTASGREIRSPEDSVRCKIAYIAKDRDIESLILNASIKENIALPSLTKLGKAGFVSADAEKKLAEEQAGTLRIKCAGINQNCSELSGGNKQKVALGKWLGNECDIFIMDCPTRGVDIGVKATIYQIMYDLKKAGKAIIMISEEMLELIGMSDRMLIMKDGKITGELARSENIRESDVVEYMI